MKKIFQVAAAIASALAAAYAAAADHPLVGFARVADSVFDFSGTQGAQGWRYQFDRGEGTSVEEMPYFLPDLRWCATPSFGGVSGSPEASHCTLTAGWGHTNTAGDCNTPAQGTLRPIRAWTPVAPLYAMVRVSITPASTSSGMRFDLYSDGQLIWSRAWSYGNLPPADEWISVTVSKNLSLVVDPLGSCGSDGANQQIQIYGADCDGNLIADVVDIANGAADANVDGIPDLCQQPTCADADIYRDFNVNGADLGILLSQWGPITPLTESDLNGDGVVDGADLGLLLSFWGGCP